MIPNVLTVELETQTHFTLNVISMYSDLPLMDFLPMNMSSLPLKQYKF